MTPTAVSVVLRVLIKRILEALQLKTGSCATEMEVTRRSVALAGN